MRVIPHQTQQGLNYQHLHIDLPEGIIEPTDLKNLAIPKTINWKQGVSN
ncbi:MAG: hypothetical protein ACFBSC_12485 [Microcoleaceae cyanobacterium]